MIFLYRIMSWGLYYVGDVASRVLELFGNGELWANFWYPVYNNLMGWSGDIQDYAGFDPNKVANTDGWPWSKINPEVEEE